MRYPARHGGSFNRRRAAVKRFTRGKDLLRGWLHLISFEASLVLGTLALARAHGGLRNTASAAIAASVSAMFGASALYHRGNWAGAWHSRLQRAGSRDDLPAYRRDGDSCILIVTHGADRVAGLITIWTLTLAAGAIRMAWMSAPELVAGGTPGMTRLGQCSLFYGY